MEKADIEKFLDDVARFAQQEEEDKNLLTFTCAGDDKEPNENKITRFLNCVNGDNAEDIIDYVQENSEKQDRRDILQGLVRLYPLTRPLVLRYFQILKMETNREIKGFDFSSDVLKHVSECMDEFQKIAEGHSTDLQKYDADIKELEGKRDGLEEDLLSQQEANSKNKELQDLKTEVEKLEKEISDLKNEKEILSQKKKDKLAERDKLAAEKEKEDSEVQALTYSMNKMKKNYKNNTIFVKELEKILPKFPTGQEG